MPREKNSDAAIYFSGCISSVFPFYPEYVIPNPERISKADFGIGSIYPVL
jgi:hypothetical protein